jgi:hypothetical protein
MDRIRLGEIVWLFCHRTSARIDEIWVAKNGAVA